ncbi:MAG TPA: FliG C-terminal domain-containing protein [Pirellulaceae bacterium]|nr:FliG C-terminal domain-containing protein [Pirellulaceae bacterium]
MIALSSEERIAILLSAIGADMADATIGMIEPSRAQELKRLYQELRDSPPSPDELAMVVDDFLKFFQFAVDSLELSTANDRPHLPAPGEHQARSSVRYFPKIVPSGNPGADLNRLDPYQIAEAIKTDHPKTIALVLQEIDTKRAAQVLELLSSEMRAATIVQLTCESKVPAAVIHQVLTTTVEKACTVEFRPEVVDHSQVLAELMRSLPKQVRSELMERLEQADQGIADQVKSKLYVFGDILRLSDRDIQKLLAQIETEAMVVGLQRCDQAISDKLLANLSKRARESIVEEMEFKQNATDQEIAEARAKIVESLAQLDESGEISL